MEGRYRVAEGQADGWCEGYLGQLMNERGGCMTMNDTKEWRALEHM